MASRPTARAGRAAPPTVPPATPRRTPRPTRVAPGVATQPATRAPTPGTTAETAETAQSATAGPTRATAAASCPASATAARASRQPSAATATARTASARCRRAPRTAACTTNGACCSGNCTAGACVPLNTTLQDAQQPLHDRRRLLLGALLRRHCGASSFCGQNGDVCAVGQPVLRRHLHHSERRRALRHLRLSRPPAPPTAASPTACSAPAAPRLGDAGPPRLRRRLLQPPLRALRADAGPRLPAGQRVPPRRRLCAPRTSTAAAPPGSRAARARRSPATSRGQHASALCRNPQGCKPDGDICKLATMSCNASCDCCSGNCQNQDTCKQDTSACPAAPGPPASRRALVRLQRQLLQRPALRAQPDRRRHAPVHLLPARVRARVRQVHHQRRLLPRRDLHRRPGQRQRRLRALRRRRRGDLRPLRTVLQHRVGLLRRRAVLRRALRLPADVEATMPARAGRLPRRRRRMCVCGNGDRCPPATCVPDPPPSGAKRCRAPAGDGACHPDGAPCALGAECCGGRCDPSPTDAGLLCGSSCVAAGARARRARTAAPHAPLCLSVHGALVCAPGTP